jgi:hypothetical protein
MALDVNLQQRQRFRHFSPPAARYLARESITMSSKTQSPPETKSPLPGGSGSANSSTAVPSAESEDRDVIFWAWIWGGMGLLLAVPVVGANKIVCDHVDSLRGLGAWLGDY